MKDSESGIAKVDGEISPGASQISKINDELSPVITKRGENLKMGDNKGSPDKAARM